jgi:hypothetical protein
MERNVPFATREGHRYSGHRRRAVGFLTLTWDDVAVKLAIFDPRDERLAIKTSEAGRVAPRAGIAEVAALLADAR